MVLRTRRENMSQLYKTDEKSKTFTWSCDRCVIKIFADATVLNISELSGLKRDQWRMQDFPEEGRQLQRRLFFCEFFPKNCNSRVKCWSAIFCIHANEGPVINMNQLKSIYNNPFKDSKSHPIYTYVVNFINHVLIFEDEEAGVRGVGWVVEPSCPPPDLLLYIIVDL